LRDLPNVVLSPHQAYNTPESLERMLDVVVANIESFLAGIPANLVGPPIRSLPLPGRPGPKSLTRRHLGQARQRRARLRLTVNARRIRWRRMP